MSTFFVACAKNSFAMVLSSAVKFFFNVRLNRRPLKFNFNFDTKNDWQKPDLANRERDGMFYMFFW